MPCRAPPPAKGVGQTVAPVLGKVQDQQIDHEAGQGMGVERGQPILELLRDHVMETQPAVESHEGWCQQGKDRQRNNAQAVEHGVQHIHPYRLAPAPPFRRPEGLQRTHDRISDRQFKNTDENELDTLEAHLHITGQPQRKKCRLDQAVEQPALGSDE